MNATLTANTTSLSQPAAPVAAGAGSAWAALCASCLAVIDRASGTRSAAETEAVFLRRIDRGGTHWISRPQGRRVVCDSGVLWLCFDGETGDVLLRAGEAHVCMQRSRLSIYALEAGSFHLA